MPDLHDELAAAAERRQPAHLPAFAQVLETRRRRDRRNRAAGGAAIASVVLAGIVAAPGLTGGRSDVLNNATGASPAATAALLDRCIGGDNSERAEEYIGLTESEAMALADQRGEPLRVVGRDVSCQPIDFDLRPGRVNVLVQDGRVVAAAVEQAPVDTAIRKRIDSVRTDPDGRGLVAAYTGGACDGPATLEAEEFSDRVEIVVQTEPKPGRSAEDACILIGIGSTVRADLQAPLGDRDVVSGGRVLDVYDGSNLIIPTQLPDGFTLTSEAGTAQGAGWSQTYSRLQPDRSASACNPDARSISVTTGPSALDSYSAPHFRDQGDVRVGDATGRHYTQPGAPVQYLTLRVDGAPVALTYSADCGSAAPPLTDLTEFAELLRPVTE